MASTCPKCGYKLRLRDYKPECPECGINLVYYGMEERLRTEADKAEMEYALSKPKTDRIKAATVGNRLSQVRLGLYLLPIIATLLPLGSYTLNIPFYEKTTKLSIISIVSLVQSLDFGALMDMTKSDAWGSSFLMLVISLACLLLMLVLCLVSMGLLTLSCSPKGLVRNFTFNIVNICLAATSAVTFSIAAKNFSAGFDSICTSASLSWGVYVVILAFLICLTMNIIQKVKGIEVKYTDVSEYMMPYEERPSTIAARAEEAAAQAAAKAEENAVKA